MLASMASGGRSLAKQRHERIVTEVRLRGSARVAELAELLLVSEMTGSYTLLAPLQDTALPPCDGLFIGGGFPETHMAELEVNEVMRAAVARFIASAEA